MRRLPILIVLLVACCCGELRAQSTNASVTGYITDPTKAVIVGAKVIVINVGTNIRYEATTSSAGSYDVTNLPPGPYRIEVEKPGFKTVVKSDVILHVQDIAAINFEMALGSASEIVTVTAGGLVVNTTDATVSTVVDRQFAENLPLNGRSFQTLIQLTPGVALTATNNFDNGQFSVNGQRAASNYWMVDGVSANVGISPTNQTGNGLSGAMPSFSALGGTNSLVSVDAMQEFRIQTSTYAPEFGRTPGGQISIITRSGTNQWHGSAFEYLRNDVLDANDWFANATKQPKPQERQNDFGGTFSGPILKEKTFFFFSYEGLRLRLPQVAQTLVPDLSARQNAVPAMQPYLNAFPLPTPNTPDDVANGIAQFNASFSNSASLDAYSLRVDHRLSNKLDLFGRYNYSPSQLVQRGPGVLSNVLPVRITTQLGTVGTTYLISPMMTNDLRFNYSRTSASSYSYLDGFGGAVPLASLPLPSPFTSQNAGFQFFPIPLQAQYSVGLQGNNLQRQINIVDSLSLQKGSHSLKFGVDFRRLSPFYGNAEYLQRARFASLPAAENGVLSRNRLQISSTRNATLLFRNLGAFAQDTWRIVPRLTLTYGLRWDLDFAPSSNPEFSAVTGFNLSDFSNLALAPDGAQPYRTTYGNVAPRGGLAYQLSQAQGRQTVLRGGFGVFFDMASSEAGNLAYYFYYPFGVLQRVTVSKFPASSAETQPPPITSASVATSGGYGFDPNLKLPYTLQWNFAVEQSIGQQQSITASYIGSAGRRLTQSALVNSPNANFASFQFVTNAATSDYDALQLQFQRRLSHGLQALASYTWSHSIDSASAGSLGGGNANILLPGLVNSNRAPSDFDIRHSASAGITYDIPAPKSNLLVNVVLRGWSTESFIIVRSAVPVTVSDGNFFFINNDFAQVRPDVVAGQPYYLYGGQYPGGKALNPAAFADPPVDPSTGNPLRQGNAGRNAFRGFGASQWDFAVHRDFPIREAVKLQFRAEMFNVLNHPNFSPPVADISNQAQFGLSTQTLGNYLSGGGLGLSVGGLSSLYQVGGPRSIQFALKLQF